MGMEEFFAVLSEIALKILPVAGVILLIYLIVLVHRLLGVLTNVNKAVESANQTIHEVEIQVRKLDAPLQTATELSESVTKIHRLSEHAVKTVALMMAENFAAIKEYLQSIFNKEKSEPETEPNNENDLKAEEIIQKESSSE